MPYSSSLSLVTDLAAFLQRRQRLIAPITQRARLMDAIGQRHQPKGQIRMPLMLRVQPTLHLTIGSQEIFLTLPEMPQVLLARFSRHQPPEEQLQQQLIAERLHLRFPCEPLLQLPASRPREPINLATAPALLSSPPTLLQFLRFQPLERGINLSVALAPEEPDALLHRLADVIPRHRPQAQHAQDGVFAALSFDHLSA